MKFFLTAFVATLAFCTHAFALDQAKLDKFKALLQVALVTKDSHALNQLFYTEGASQYQIDGAIYGFESSLASMTFDKVEFMSLDDPSINPNALKSMIGGETKNGHLYVPNLKPVVFCDVTFKGKNDSSSGSVLPLGIDPSGNFRFVMEKLAVGMIAQP